MKEKEERNTQRKREEGGSLGKLSCSAVYCASGKAMLILGNWKSSSKM